LRLPWPAPGSLARGYAGAVLVRTPGLKTRATAGLLGPLRRGYVITLSLIGMSGAGKSFWAQRLGAAGFRVISIDDRIEAKLASALAAGGHRGIGGVAAWMGWPTDATYRDRENQYLQCEVAAMNEALDEMQSAGEEGIVLDTTGSVAYTGDEICRRMQSLSTVVYLAASPAEEELLIARYLSDPKPVLWRDQFSQRPGESPEDAIARCYPQLIAHRKQMYARYARRTISMQHSHNEGLDARGFLELIEGQARPA
jgi:shikimate kinase